MKNGDKPINPTSTFSPGLQSYHQPIEHKHVGLTKREHIAIEFAKAMLCSPALLEAVTSWDITIGDAKTKVAIQSIDYADELLKQLESNP